MKILVVDDEELIRDSIVDLVADLQCDASEILTARSGFEAIEIVMNKKPEILITDVKMPGMSGLELAEKSKAYNSDIKTVFISGYGELDYLKRAIQLRAYDYLIKPVNAADFKKVINRVIQDIREEAAKQNDIESLKTYVRESKPIISSKLLEELIFNATLTENAKRLIDSLNIDTKKGSHIVVIFEVDDYMMIKESLTKIDLNSIIPDIWDNPDNIYRDYVTVSIISSQDSRTVAVLSSAEDGCDDEYDFLDCIEKSIAYLLDEVKQRVHISISAGIGTTVCDLVDLHESYNISCLAIAQKFFHGKGRILKYAERKFSDIYNLKINDINNELIKGIMNFDMKKVNLHIESLFRIIVAQNLSRDYILNICMELINRLTIVLIDYNITLNDVFGNNVVLWLQLLKYETLNDIQGWIKYMYTTVILHVKNNTLKQCDRAIEKTIQYIEKNYMKEISLKDISDELHYSTNYLGNLFKKHLKKGFREYLTEYRIRKAAELLRQNRYKIYEVSEMVGYKNVPSFIKQFKSIFMVTPAEYSERC